MGDGGQTVDQWYLVERAARRLARALGTGYGWRPDVNEVITSGPGREMAPLSSALAISRRGESQRVLRRLSPVPVMSAASNSGASQAVSWRSRATVWTKMHWPH
jgi:hypothetical protein